MAKLHHVKVKSPYPEDHYTDSDTETVITTTDGLIKRAFWRAYNSRRIMALRRATLNFLFPVHVTITPNRLPENGYTCKVRDGFIDIQMWHSRYPDGQLMFKSARIPCALIPSGFHGQKVQFRQRGKIVRTTPEVQQTFDAWLKENTIHQPEGVSLSDNPRAALNAGVRHGTATSCRKGRWKCLRWGKMEDWANGKKKWFLEEGETA